MDMNGCGRRWFQLLLLLLPVTVSSAERVLILGNSITYHTPSTALGWTGAWGMAASSPDSDYVHRLMTFAKEKNSEMVFLVDAVSRLEKAESRFSFSDSTGTKYGFDEYRDFMPDYVILRLGDNVTTSSLSSIGGNLNSLLSFVGNQRGQCLVTGCFFPKSGVDSVLRLVAKQNGCRYVMLGDLYEDSTNCAFGAFPNMSVAKHPSDKGMDSIASRIWRTWQSDSLTTGVGYEPGAGVSRMNHRSYNVLGQNFRKWRQVGVLMYSSESQ